MDLRFSSIYFFSVRALTVFMQGPLLPTTGHMNDYTATMPSHRKTPCPPSLLNVKLDFLTQLVCQELQLITPAANSKLTSYNFMLPKAALPSAQKSTGMSYVSTPSQLLAFFLSLFSLFIPLLSLLSLPLLSTFFSSLSSFLSRMAS